MIRVTFFKGRHTLYLVSDTGGFVNPPAQLEGQMHSSRTISLYPHACSRNRCSLLFLNSLLFFIAGNQFNLGYTSPRLLVSVTTPSSTTCYTWTPAMCQGNVGAILVEH